MYYPFWPCSTRSGHVLPVLAMFYFSCRVSIGLWPQRVGMASTCRYGLNVSVWPQTGPILAVSLKTGPRLAVSLKTGLRLSYLASDYGYDASDYGYDASDYGYDEARTNGLTRPELTV